MNGINEESIYETLGVTRTGEGAQVQEFADPAAQGQSELTGEGGKAREAAGPVPEGEESESEGAKGQETAEEPGVPGPEGTESTQTEEETRRARADAAAHRRREEQQAAISKAVSDALDAEREKHNAELAAFFQAAGLKNTITDTPITNMDEFRA